jgi:OsmC subfamily peroxiredoxin
MAVRTASAEWNGTLQDGNGTMSAASGAFEGAQYSASSRFEEGTGTNPEELIAAAHAGCFSMALSLALAERGAQPESIRTEARVQLLKEGDGFAIKKIDRRRRRSAAPCRRRWPPSRPSRWTRRSSPERQSTSAAGSISRTGPVIARLTSHGTTPSASSPPA